jgi:hypothetical protein
VNRRFDAYEVALELAAALGPLIGAIAQRDSSLSCQLRRAAASVPLCLAEGACRSGKDRLHVYRSAGVNPASLFECLRSADGDAQEGGLGAAARHPAAPAGRSGRLGELRAVPRFVPAYPHRVDRPAPRRPEVFEQRLRYFLKKTARNERFGMVQ